MTKNQFAQDKSGKEPLPSGKDVASVPPSVDPAAADETKFKRFDDLAEPGLTTNFPGSADTLFRDDGGWRSYLADRNIAIQSRASLTVSYNPLETGQPHSPQRYNGQRLTLQGQSVSLIATFGLQSVGLPNSRLIVGANYLVTSFRPNGPSTITIRNLEYYQSFLDKKVEFKLGVTTNYFEFVGLYTGGAPVLASGINGLIPVQVGLSADPAPAPTANLTVNFKHGGYLKVGVQRSISPMGTPYEVTHNGIGVDLTMKGAGPLMIGEVGIKRPAGVYGKQIWLRAGGIYNHSEYVRFDGKGFYDNRSVYAAGDLQLSQTDRLRPGRGIYLGGSAFWATPKVNTYTQTFEGRIYNIGVLDSRPMDTASLRVTYSKFSGDGRLANSQRGVFANAYQMAVTASYSYHAGPGIYVTPAISYIRHPSFIGDFKDALNLTGVLYTIF